ncbi:MAG: hypothetical protein H6539_04695 [Bacteroidales bacterium]|nr:hypothetical protein [Bacteroidales bacterium]
MSLKLYKPEVFQGSLSKKNYFEGWYFKNVSADQKHVYSFIPGVSLTGKNPHSFIQVINGINGKTDYLSYPLSDFSWESDRLSVRVGDSVFTENSVELNIKDPGLKVKGKLSYSNLTKYPQTLFSPGIMGWYSFIPFMECKHGIVSANHIIQGSIEVSGESIDFNEGKGYIEKDWGSSFPEAWIWMQANSFNERSVSFNFSIAKIPWLGSFFIGFIGFIFFNKEFYIYSTYNNSKILEINHSDQSLSIVLENRKSVLKVHADKSTFGELIAPVSGDMSRRIKESVDSDISVELFDEENNLIYSGFSKRAGLEIIEKIFDYKEIQKIVSGR